MHNEPSQANSNQVWNLFMNEAKVRLVDAKSAAERREWRMAIHSLEGLIRRKVRLPRRAVQQLSSRARSSATQC
jgi:hypothetical protein